MVGKKIASDFYIHRKYIDKMKQDLYSLFKSARGEISHEYDQHWNLVKVNKLKERVSFLIYPTFDIEAHPELRESVSVNLTVSPPIVRKIKGRGQILHRKELFIDKDYPNYLKFVELTEKEEELGLLKKDVVFKGKKLGLTMGRKEIWGEWLEFNNVRIEDHEIVNLEEK